jgi:hypothetical protein
MPQRAAVLVALKQNVLQAGFCTLVLWARLHSGYNLILHADLGCAILIKSINIYVYECTNNFQRLSAPSICSCNLGYTAWSRQPDAGNVSVLHWCNNPQIIVGLKGLASILGKPTWSCLWLHSLNYFSSSPSRFVLFSPSKLDHVLSAPQPLTTGHSTAHCCILQDDWRNP